jgi:hypothetical protein
MLITNHLSKLGLNLVSIFTPLECEGFFSFWAFGTEVRTFLGVMKWVFRGI